jgi:hypothetical protein
LREPETLLTFDGDGLRHQLARLLGLVLAFQHFDLAFEIVELARRVRLLPQTDLTRLAEEVERAAALSTRYMQHKAEEERAPASLMAPSFRDKHQLE